jgi:hypothetical protein
MMAQQTQTPFDVAAKTLLVNIGAAEKGNKDSTASTNDKALIGGLLSQACDNVKQLQVEHNDLVAKHATTTTIAITSGAKGGLTFRDGMVSIAPLPTPGNEKNVKAAADVLNRWTAVTTDTTARLQAYAELWSVQSAFKLSEEALWIMLLQLKDDLRDVLAVTHDHSSLQEWHASLSRALTNIPVQRFEMWSARRESGEMLSEAIRRFTKEHRLPLLVNAFPPADVREFLTSATFLGRNYVDQNPMAMKKLRSGPATATPTDI